MYEWNIYPSLIVQKMSITQENMELFVKDSFTKKIFMRRKN